MAHAIGDSEVAVVQVDTKHIGGKIAAERDDETQSCHIHRIGIGETELTVGRDEVTRVEGGRKVEEMVSPANNRER